MVKQRLIAVKTARAVSLSARFVTEFPTSREVL